MKDSTSSVRGGYRATAEQKLLLRAALLSDSNAIEAWNLWKAQRTLENIDAGSYRLLPLVYRNLLAAGIKNDSYLRKLKGIHRHTWSKNQVLIHKVAELLKVFQAAGIKTLLLKGAALISVYYEDYGLRPMNDVDVLVPPEQSVNASKLLEQNGFNPKHPEWQIHFPFLNSLGYQDDERIQLDLHWYVFRECRKDGADASIWQHSQVVEIHNVSWRIMSPADQLLHVCVHGAKWNTIPAIRWIVDAVQILRSEGSRFDWQRLLLQTKERRFIMQMKDALSQLAELTPELVPLEILGEIERAPASPTERYEHHYNIRSNKWSLWGRFPKFWFDYHRHADQLPRVQKWIGFLTYLRKFYGVEHWISFPFLFLLIAARRARRITLYCFSRLAKII